MSDSNSSMGRRDPVPATRKSPRRKNTYPTPDTLVAIVKYKSDLPHARDDGWYRVPVEKAPPELANGHIHTLALYLPKGHGVDEHHVAYTAPIQGITTATRRELLPDEANHLNADKPYLRLALGPVRRLPHPIPSPRWRRISFISTTEAKMRLAKEINDLYHDSPLEDEVWAAFKSDGIPAERQYFVPDDRRPLYALDFAIFCQRRKLDVECDGDLYHANPARAKVDMRRDNFLATHGWAILRFNTESILEALPEVIAEVRKMIDESGGTANVSTDSTEAPAPNLLWQPALWAPDIAFGSTVDPHPPAPKRRPRAKRGANTRYRIPEQPTLLDDLQEPTKQSE